jgi:2-keto-3-deoxy-L-rhamnonate aldolase RhmA
MNDKEQRITHSLIPTQKLKQKLQNGETTFGLWVTLESPTVSEMAAHIGLDWICIDTEHGGLQLQDVASHLRAIGRSSTVALVRIQGIEQGLIQGVLGLGAHGILVPRIRTAEEVEQAVSFAKYPPRGSRGMGVERSTLWGMGIGRAREANEETLVIPLIETVDAGRNIEAIMQVPDVDGFFFGPADFSASAGFVGEWEGPGIADELLRLKQRVRARRFACGIVATDVSNGKLRIDQGFQMIGLGVDCTILMKTLVKMTDALAGREGT